MTEKIRLPDETQHIAIAGRTGTGKTTAALELLSTRDFERMAWIIIDHKREDHIAKLNARELDMNSFFLPEKGLHVVRPGIGREDTANLDGFLMRAFRKGNIGIYVDEGHLLGHSTAIRNIMVAGRSKRVPVIWVSQRASWIDPFIWSQASFYRVFNLQTKHDTKRFEENLPIRWKPPEEYHSYYYDVSKGKVYYLKPAAPLEDTIRTIDDALRVRYTRV